MTLYNSREIPHPVLKPGGTDYIKGTLFRAEVKGDKAYKNPEDGRVYLHLAYSLNDEGLLDLIDRGDANYISLTDSVRSHRRETHPSAETETTIILDGSEYSGTITIQPFVTAKTDIRGFSSRGWNNWLKSILPNGSDMPQGAILAIGTTSVFDTEGTPDIESCVQLVNSADVERGRYAVRLDSENISIQVNSLDRPAIDTMRSNEDHEGRLWPSIYQSAIEQAVRKHALPENEDRKWAGSIAAALARHELDTSDADVLTDNSLVYAQIIMENPLTRITEQFE